MLHYLDAVEAKSGRPCLHLIPRLTEGKAAWSSPSDSARRDIDMLETALIAMALGANPKVRNGKKTWFNKNCFVPGVMGPASKGRKPESARTLRRVLGLD